MRGSVAVARLTFLTISRARKIINPLLAGRPTITDRPAGGGSRPREGWYTAAQRKRGRRWSRVASPGHLPRS